MNQLLGWQEFKLDEDLHTFLPFYFAVYFIELYRALSASKTFSEKSHIYMSLVKLVSIQPSLRPLKLLSFFFISFCFFPICFCLFALRFLKVLAFHQRNFPPRRYIDYPTYRFFKTVYQLGEASTASNKQVGDNLQERAKT